MLIDSARLPDSYHVYIARIEPDGSLAGFWQVYVAGSVRITPNGVVPSTEKKLSAVRMRPGRYVFTRVLQNLHWQACMWAGTLTFEVRPGVASYIGEVDPRPVLDGMVAHATAEGLTRSPYSGGVHQFRERFPPLRAIGPTAERVSELDRDRARLFRALSAPVVAQTAAPLEFASYQASGRLCR
ncbi:hypothetical protein CKY28_08085 [Sphingomonas lenta]|uniref:Uncharacterized protein n=1 Tax=Sphingomonas lenta TaxID=1141887 RepID=A0A2A2SEJ1_9SPHN|nr:hypothetical protein CKY28_08085 [Sphingomonas lenta]